MNYYAEICPRGFANEIRTYKFSSRANRDAFVASEDADAITRKRAERNVRYKGDAATQSYNSDLIDGDYEIKRKADDYNDVMYRYTSFK